MRKFDHEEELFRHLVRLSWDLSQFGLAHAVECPSKVEPFIAVRRARGHLYVRAALRGEQWIFTWGHGRGRWVDAYDVDAATRVWEVAR